MIDWVKAVNRRRVGSFLVSHIRTAAMAIGIALALHQSPAAAVETLSDTAVEMDAIRTNIDRYVRSITEANPDLAKGLWLQTDEASFVNPAGEEAGWIQIRDHFYLGLMGKMFSTRKLQLVGAPQIKIFDCAAIVQFHWDFVATRRDSQKVIHTFGRETQVYSRQSDGRWLLVHVHYSGPPVKLNAGANGF